MKMSLLILLLLFPITLFAEGGKIRIYAAASLTNVLQEVAKDFKDAEVVFNFDATSRLAKQIESGAPADLFFSADSEWMEYLKTKGKVEKGSQVDLLSNKIVVIVPADSKSTPVSAKDLQQEFYHHIALAGEAVPAGKFARAALKAERVLDEAFIKKVVNADNVRIALSWVARHEAAAGVVYATDVKIEPKVKIAFAFDETTYPKIIYPAAVVKNSTDKKNAKAFLTHCRNQGARAIFAKAGFINL